MTPREQVSAIKSDAARIAALRMELADEMNGLGPIDELKECACGSYFDGECEPCAKLGPIAPEGLSMIRTPQRRSSRHIALCKHGGLWL